MCSYPIEVGYAFVYGKDAVIQSISVALTKGTTLGEVLLWSGEPISVERITSNLYKWDWGTGHTYSASRDALYPVRVISIRGK